MEHERVLRAALPGLEIHGAAHVAVAPGPARDREGAVLRVIERALHGDLPTGQEHGPVALVGAAGDGADAVAVVRPHLVGVGGIEDVVGEREHVAGAVSGRARIGCRVRRRVLDDGHRVAAALLVAVALTFAPGSDAESDGQGHRGQSRDARETLHGVAPWFGETCPTGRAVSEASRSAGTRWCRGTS